MDIELGASVIGTDGKLGCVEAIVVHPHPSRVTHLVVRHGVLWSTQKLVPIEALVRASHAEVEVRLTHAQFDALSDFLKQDFIESPPDGTFPSRQLTPPGFLWPSSLVGWYMPADAAPSSSVLAENLPSGEVSLKVGTEVFASDGRVGHVEEVCFDPVSGRASSIVVRRGFFFHRDVALPVDWIRTFGDRVVLTCSKADLERHLADDDLPPKCP